MNALKPKYLLPLELANTCGDIQKDASNSLMIESELGNDLIKLIFCNLNSEALSACDLVCKKCHSRKLKF